MRRREEAISNTIVRSCSLVLSALAFAPATTRAEPAKLPVPAIDQSTVGQRGYFYVGGKYVGEPGKEIMQGQVYVEVLAPKNVRRHGHVMRVRSARTPSSLSDSGFDLREVVNSAASRAVSPARIRMAAVLASARRLTEVATRLSGRLSRC